MNEQIGYSLDPDTTASYCPFHSSEKKEKKWVRISWMDANIIRKPPSAALWAGLPTRTMALLAGKHTCQGNNKERKRLGTVFPYLVHVVCFLAKISSSRGQRPHPPFQDIGVTDHLSCCLTVLGGSVSLACGLNPLSW
jgi:hypothetical protein